MIRALIVDDELHAREELAALLLETGEFEIVGCCANAMEAIKAINRERPQVLFLDIEMPVLSGFQLLSMIDPGQMPNVVFVTAYDEFALKAFEEKTLDYLLKPVDRERLAKTVEKLKSAVGVGSPPSYETPALSRIPCVGVGRIKLIDPAEVDYVRSDPSGVHLVTVQGECFTELTLKVLEQRTDLLRCHKQYLVNAGRIDEILLQEGGCAEIRTRAGATLPVSRRYLKSLRDAFNF